jgi:hypothetical protein
VDEIQRERHGRETGDESWYVFAAMTSHSAASWKTS